MKKLIYLFLLTTFSATSQGVTFYAYDRNFQAGDTVNVEVSASGFDEITSFQWALMFDTAALKWHGLTFTGAMPDYDQACCFGLFSMGYLVKPGEIRSVWTDPYGYSMPDNSHIFAIVLVAKQAGKLSEKLTVYPQGLSPLASYFPLHEIPLAWEFLEIMKIGPLQCRVDKKQFASQDREQSETQTAQAVTVTPNPFTDSFTLNASGPLRVTNIAGQIVLFGRYQAGQPLGESLAPGLYFGKIGNQTFKIVKQ